MAFHKDPLDRATELAESERAHNEAEIRRKAASMEQGAPGVCAECGREMPRLVRGLCCPCRDALGVA